MIGRKHIKAGRRRRPTALHKTKARTTQTQESDTGSGLKCIKGLGLWCLTS
jgi:hypothetical protein